MKSSAFGIVLSVLPLLVASTDNNQNIREDQLGTDNDLEIIHLYRGQWPTGIAVSAATGRKFSAFPSGFDELNTNNGSNNVFQVAELTGFDSETAYPNEEINNPPGGCVDTSGPFPVSKGDSEHLLSVQTVVVVEQTNTLWILDAGRCLYNGLRLGASYGGPKLISVDLDNNQVKKTIVLPSDVAGPISYMSDVTFDDLDYAYIADLSPEQDNALIILNLVTGDSHRVLVQDFTVTALPGVVPFLYRKPLYQVRRSPSGQIAGYQSITNGVDGVALSSDYQTLFFGGAVVRFLYSVPTNLLRDRNISETDISSAVRVLGDPGFTSVISTDNTDNIYTGNGEQDGVSVYNSTTGFLRLLFRDKRINFVGRLDVAADNYLYGTVNQFHRLPSIYQPPGPLGVDLREEPYFAFRYPLPPGTNGF